MTAIRRAEPWEYEVLRLTAEQHGIPFDQLSRFLGHEVDVTRMARHLRTAGFADYGRVLAGEPHWLWLTRLGARLSGTEFVGGRPMVGVMNRIRAVNEVRLYITRRAPEAHWVCGRTVVREQGRRGHRPDAVVEIGDERHAILVRCGRPRSGQRESEFVESLMRGYAVVVVFCSPAPGDLYRRLADEHRWPKLVVRPIPEAPGRDGGGG